MEISEVRTLACGLRRPEGVMALDDGTLLASDARGGCSRIPRNGEASFFGSVGGLPNGICVDREGNCIIANIGNGQIQALAPSGRHRVLMTEAGGRRMTTPNFPFLDSKGRLWVSHSTARRDMEQAIASPAPDGCIVLMEEDRARIVAEGIFFANGLTLDREEKYLYVAETMKRDILRYRIGQDGSLADREVYGPDFLGRLGFPDGIAFDEAQNLWVTFPAWNAVGVITARGELKIVLEDPEGKVLKRPSNICFGWEGRRTAFIGSLEGTTIPFFEVPHPGLRLVHQT